MYCGHVTHAAVLTAALRAATPARDVTASEPCVDDSSYAHLEGVLELSDYANDVVVVGSHAFVADRDAGILIAVIESTLAMSVEGSVETEGDALALAAREDLLLVVEQGAGVALFDISEPTLPARVGSFAGFDCPVDVDVAVDHAYVADCETGLHIVSIADPSEPVLLSSVPMTSATRVTVEDGYAYVSDSTGLRVVDVTEPNFVDAVR